MISLTEERWQHIGIVNQDPYIGEEYGIYEIIEATDKRSRDGHIIYRGKCKKCGYVREAKISSFKQQKPQKCRHKNMLADEEIKLWYEQNKKKCLHCGKDIQ